MINKIPGADYLGCGFNINGKFDSSSATFQLFQQSYSKQQTYTHPSTKITYLMPDNVALIPNSSTQGAIHVFQTKQEFQKFFAGKASLQMSEGLLSGEFNTAYSQTLNTSNSYYYCLCENESTGWELRMQDESFRVLSETFTEDPGVKNLPSTFTAQNQEQFFEVFRKFGTHFISRVVLGGSMRYYVAVNKAYSSQSNEISANLTLEYNALFFKTKDEAEADWKTIDQEWTQSRFSQIQSKGGDDSMLNTLSPTRPNSYGNFYAQWLNSLMSNPCIINFQLRPLSQLFPSDRVAAVNQAIWHYNNDAIKASATIESQGATNNLSWISAPCITMNRQTITPDPFVPLPPYKQVNTPSNSPHDGINCTEPLGGYQIVLFECDTYRVLFSRIYYVDQSEDDHYLHLQVPAASQKVYVDIMNDLNKIDYKDYICAVSAFGIDGDNLPSSNFMYWLESCGAELGEWKKGRDEILHEPGPEAEGWWKVCYTCIGKKGSSSGYAIEDFNTLVWNYGGSANATSTYLLNCQEANINTVKALKMAAASVEVPDTVSHNAQEAANL